MEAAPRAPESKASPLCSSLEFLAASLSVWATNAHMCQGVIKRIQMFSFALASPVSHSPVYCSRPP